MILQVAEGAKSRKYQVDSQPFKGRAIGDVIQFSLEGKPCTLLITGASTNTGTPCVKSYVYPRYSRIRYKQNTRKGYQCRKLVYGNVLTDVVAAVSVKLVNGRQQA